MSKFYARCINPTKKLIKNKIYLVKPVLRRNFDDGSFTYLKIKKFNNASHLIIYKTSHLTIGYNLIVKKDRFIFPHKTIQDRIKNTKKGEKVELTDLFHQPKQQFDYKPMKPQPIYNVIYEQDPHYNEYGVDKETVISSLRQFRDVPEEEVTLQKIYWDGTKLITEDVTEQLKWEPQIP